MASISNCISVVDPTVGGAIGETVLALIGGDNAILRQVTYLPDSLPTNIDGTDTWSLEILLEDSEEVLPTGEYVVIFTGPPPEGPLDLIALAAIYSPEIPVNYRVRLRSVPLGDAYDPGGQITVGLSWEDA
jgi:hypothetical protein